MKQRKNIGAFCMTYGNTIENRVLEHLLENQYLDVAVGDMAGEIKVSRPKAYEVIKEFEKKGYIKKSRIVGKTQLYKLDKDNGRVRLFLRNFKECLKLIIEECSDCNKSNTCSPVSAGIISAKHI